MGVGMSVAAGPEEVKGGFYQAWAGTPPSALRISPLSSLLLDAPAHEAPRPGAGTGEVAILAGTWSLVVSAVSLDVLCF